MKMRASCPPSPVVVFGTSVESGCPTVVWCIWMSKKNQPRPYRALASVIVIHTWQWTPFAFLVFLATLHALPQEPLEAAKLDCQSWWQQFRYVILPLVRPAIVIVVILRTIVALNAFGAIYAATGGGPGLATEILNLYVYETSFVTLSVGYGAALGTTQLLITVAVALVFFRIRRAHA